MIIFQSCVVSEDGTTTTTTYRVEGRLPNGRLLQQTLVITTKSGHVTAEVPELRRIAESGGQAAAVGLLAEWLQTLSTELFVADITGHQVPIYGHMRPQSRNST